MGKKLKKKKKKKKKNWEKNSKYNTEASVDLMSRNHYNSDDRYK